MMKKLIKDLTLVNWLPNLKIILRGLLNNTEVNAANIKKVSSDIDTTNKKVGKIEGEVEVLKEDQEVIKTDVEELKKGGDSVEVDETYLTKDEEGKITFGNNGTVGEIESPIIIVGEREGVTSLRPGSVIVEKPSGKELKLTPDSLELADGESSTIIDLPESTGETYNLPLTVNGVKADAEGNIEIPVGSGSELKGFKNFENDGGFVLQGSYDESTNSVIMFGEEDKPQYSKLSEEGIYVENLNEAYGIKETSSLKSGRLEITGLSTNDVGEQEQVRASITSKYITVQNSKFQNVDLESERIHFQNRGRTEMLIKPESIRMLDKVTGKLVTITVENGVLVVK